MADFYATSRSNYIRVRSPEAFGKFAHIWDCEVHQGTGKNRNKYCLLVHTDKGTIPNFTLNPDNEEEEWDNHDFLTQLTSHLKDGEVIIMEEGGAEKFRYIGGYAFAMNSKGKMVEISISEIHDRLGDLCDDPKKVTGAQY